MIIIVKVNYKLFKKSFMYICTNCNSLLHEYAEICERCGKKDTLKKVTKKDYKLKFKKVKEL